MKDSLRMDRVRRFIGTLNQACELGLTVESAGDGELLLRLPYSDFIVGNPDTGVIHGGAITTLMDTASGSVILCALPDFELCPTLDLRAVFKGVLGDHLGVSEQQLSRSVFPDSGAVRPVRDLVRG
jgi:uncharacterized protein (TIGR00369 family)